MRRLVAALPLALLLTLSLLLAPAGPLAVPLLGHASAALAQAPAPTAQFTVSVPALSDPTQNARVHDVISFDAGSSQGAGLSYAWDFGDGSVTANGRTVSHSFSQVDDYTVTLTVTDSSGQSASSSQSVRVVPLVDSLVARPALKQIVPAAVVPVLLNIQAPGPGDLTATLTGDLVSSKPADFSTSDDLEFVTLKATVADERNATINQQIIQTPGGTVPLQGNVGLKLSYQTSAGTSVTLYYDGSLQKDRDLSKGYWSISYPDFSLVTGTTDPSQPDMNGFYLNGDPGFHHPEDPLVRRYAIQAARAGGAFPDDPATVMDNIYTYVGGLFNSDDPAQIEPDTVIAQKIASGELVPGQRLEKYICISQTYFLSSLSRTLGLPTRELTIALANPVEQNTRTGAWTVSYVQEGASQVWFDGQWHLYDTWLRQRRIPDYLIRKLALQAWYAYSPQTYDLRAKNGDPLGLHGHNFAIGENEGVPADPSQWYLLTRQIRDGITIVDWPGVY